MNLYNEIEAYPAQWLRNLIDAGHIVQGEVDERSVEDLQPEDLEGVTQAHFFAGIGVWSYALRLAGWPDDVPVWTGSCPCQPFSTAGRGKGTEDSRHLFPVWRRLIEKCQPPIVFGEQVASPAGRNWLATVRDEMEALGYEVGAADLCAAGVGAPHVRQRVYWGAHRVADSSGKRCEGLGVQLRERGPLESVSQATRRAAPSRVGNSSSSGSGRNAGAVLGAQEKGSGQRGQPGHFTHEPIPSGETFTMANADLAGLERWEVGGDSANEWAPWESSMVDWLPCQDGKARPVEPGTFPLADGSPTRVGRIRAYGNAIVPQVAASFVMAFMESLHG